MVRKWSYLTCDKLYKSGLDSKLTEFDKLKSKNFYKLTLDTGVNFLKKRHTFKVFRSTTRFKRWTVGITKVVRKKYTRRKHLTNLMNLNFITNSWVSFYLAQRNYIRFYQGLFLIKSQYISPNSDIVLKQATKNINDVKTGLLLLGVSSKYLNHSNQTQLNKLSIFNLLNSTNSTSVNKLLLSNTLVDSKPTGVLFESTNDDLDFKYYLPGDKLLGYNQPLNLLHTTLQLNLSIRTILVLLILYNIHTSRTLE